MPEEGKSLKFWGCCMEMIAGDSVDAVVQFLCWWLGTFVDSCGGNLLYFGGPVVACMLNDSVDDQFGKTSSSSDHE
jgi:hypothetical protein